MGILSGGRLKLQHRMTLIFFAFAVLVAGLTAAVLVHTTKTQFISEIRQRLKDSVAIAALQVDARLHDRLKERSQEGSADYLAIKKTLQKIRDASTEIFFIYTMRKGPEGKILFVVDAEEKPEELAHLNQVYDDASPLLSKNFASLKEPVVEKGFYTDEWGTWLSGYAPIQRPDGSRAGVLGMDISAATVQAHERKLFWYSLAAFGLTLPLILFVGWMVGRAISRPVTEMQSVARRMGDGDLSTRLKVTRRDELGALGLSLNAMAANLEENQRQLEDMAEKYRNIFDNATEGIFQTSPEGAILTVNRAMCRMLGYDSLEQIKNEVTDLTSQVYHDPADRQEVHALLESQGAVDGKQLTLRRRDGGTVQVEMSAHIRRENQGQTLIEGILHDITNRQAREKAERRAQAAQAASQAKSEFLANMSHEIRTPLNAVMGLSDLLGRTGLDTRQKQYLAKIKTASTSLLAVINDILDFSKIEAGRLELERTGFDLQEVIANLSEMFAFQAHEKGLELLVDLDKDTPARLIGDPTRLGQILINLTGNALKFTQKGEVVVRVGPDPDRPRNDTERIMLKFEVCDTGEGIAPEALADIFESFTQADASTTRSHGGTGLGLTINRRLSRLMGGDIRVESELDKGSRFIFTAAFELQSDTGRMLPSTPRDLRGLKVLVVDDNQTAREILATLITTFQMEAVTAASGEEALEILKGPQAPFDLILLDWKMPGMGGVETARTIKQKLKQKRSPIVCMISAYGREDLLQQSDKSFLDAFLHKPVNQSLLFDTIMSLFDHEGRIGSSGQAGPDRPGAEPEACLNGGNVLLVEDNEINQEVAREWLQSAGLKVETANNGLEALGMLDKNAFDVVLMDIQMPKMDGLEATRRIREKPGLAKLPIIAMTAHALKGDRERCLEAGMNDYLSKPIDPDQLYSTLARWLGALPARQKADAESGNVFKGLDLPGISVETGLMRFNQKNALFARMLLSFESDFGPAPRKLADLLQKADWDGARTLAHSIKGVAGNLGAMELSSLAAEVEKALIAQSLDPQDPAWLAFLAELNKVLAGLARAIPCLREPDSPAEAGQDPSREDLPAMLRDLARLLDDDLNAARELAGRLLPALEAAAGAEASRDLMESLNNLDVDGALETLESIQARVGQEV